MRASRSGVGQCVAVCVATCVAVACNTGPHVLGAQTTGAAVVPADGGAASTLADGSTGSLARGDASTTLGNDGGSFPTPAACAGGGPAVTVNGGSGSQCTGLVAQTNFTFSVCSCKDARLEAQTLIDGWNSAAGPYTPGQIGGGLGADGAITADDDADIWGQAWAASTSTAFTVDSSMTVHSDLHSGGNIETSDLEVSGDAYVAGNINDSITVAKTLYQPSGKSAGDSTYGTRVVQPVTVPPPCDCTNPIPVGAIVADAKTNNDNASIGLDPAVLTTAGHASRIDLPCGRFYLNGFTLGSAETIVAHGNTAVFIDGDVTTNDSFTITVADNTSQLDIFVSGSLVATSKTKIGSTNFPALTRLYVGGSQLDIQSDLVVGGEIWAGNAKVTWESDTDMYGALFAGDFDVQSPLKLHYDEAVLQAGSSCSPPAGNDGGAPPSGGDDGGGSTCGSCQDCGNQACVNGTCGSCTSDTDCCPPLVCNGGTCVSVSTVPR